MTPPARSASASTLATSSRANVVGQGDRTRRVAAAAVWPDILDEPGAGIEGETDSVEREADDGIGVLLARHTPAERLVERARTRKIVYAQGDDAETLVHIVSFLAVERPEGSAGFSLRLG